jgi:predicted O-methyltransferase YrrM
VKISKRIKKLLNKAPYVKVLYRENELYHKNACYPPGHFYSPIVSVEELVKDRERIWGKEDKKLPGLNLRTESQLALLEEFEKYYGAQPFKDEEISELRYYYKNGYYSYTDGLVLYSFMRHFRPSRIIEAGSGFSSALMLDVNNIFLENKVSLTFIEPFPDRLRSLLRKDDGQKCKLIEKKIQDVPRELFSELGENDFLFIDSSHVAKTGSDVNYILFDILPMLKPGVLIHFHDIFYPFEYPEEWVRGGRNWNEIYLVRAFLTQNPGYEIVFFSHYLHKLFPASFSNMPLACKDHGCNFWIRKIKSD